MLLKNYLRFKFNVRTASVKNDVLRDVADVTDLGAHLHSSSNRSTIKNRRSFNDVIQSFPESKKGIAVQTLVKTLSIYYIPGFQMVVHYIPSVPKQRYVIKQNELVSKSSFGYRISGRVLNHAQYNDKVDGVIVFQHT